MERARQHLLEYVLVTAFLVIAAAGTVALFGEELRAALGMGGSAPPAPQASPTREGPRG